MTVKVYLDYFVFLLYVIILFVFSLFQYLFTFDIAHLNLFPLLDLRLVSFYKPAQTTTLDIGSLHTITIQLTRVEAHASQYKQTIYPTAPSTLFGYRYLPYYLASIIKLTFPLIFILNITLNTPILFDRCYFLLWVMHTVYCLTVYNYSINC